MKTSTKPAIIATASALPTFKQALALIVAMAEHQLNKLTAVRCADDEWHDADIHVDLAVDLALDHLARMQTMEFDDRHHLNNEWYKMASAVTLGLAAFSRPDSLYGRLLAGAVGSLQAAPEILEFAASS